ncbi:MAG: aromatic-ring-hydroxylating dioxygenase subunit beta [Myxococcales bacterium]|nr:aromatic-ring-hydroxylating dioxygenase subunit beta [Myxococcales bacterium]
MLELLRKLETRQRVEDFMVLEARLLDEWRLLEWLALMTDDVRYEVPATDVRGDYANTLGLIADDAARLRQRVDQLLGNVMWCENPRSRTRRLIANLCIQAEHADELDVLANFMIHRFGNGRSDTFVGKYDYKLVRTGDQLKIRRRTVLLDHESLMAHAKISIIL